jgi:hypothetical protein
MIAATAAPATVVYSCSMGPRWGCPAVRPHDISFGAHYALEGISWHNWKEGTATGRGHYYGFGSYEGNITLYNVHTHAGHHYFSHLKVTASGHKTRWLTFSNGFWVTG